MHRLTPLVLLPFLLGACGFLTVGRAEPVQIDGQAPILVDPLPGEGSGRMFPGPFFVESADLRVAESFPVQLFVDVEGTAPTPCHRVLWEVAESEGRRDVVISTEIEEDLVCVAVVADHSLVITLGPASDLPVEVWVNGELVGTAEG